MKAAFLTIILLAAQSGLAARITLNDLRSLPLRVKQAGTSGDVNYPNYRLGGGSPPTREIVDCLILDVLDSDNSIGPELKMKIASGILVEEGYDLGNSSAKELLPAFKGENVVFKLFPGSLYLTTITARSRTGANLDEVIEELMPPTRRGNTFAAVNLLYVRGCRF